MEIAVGFLRSGLQFVTKSKARDGLKLWSRRCEPGLLAFPWIAGIVFVTLITYQARKGVGWKRMEIWPVKVKVKNEKVPCQCRQHALTSRTKNDHFSGKKTNKQTYWSIEGRQFRVSVDPAFSQNGSRLGSSVYLGRSLRRRASSAQRIEGGQRAVESCSCVMKFNASLPFVLFFNHLCSLRNRNNILGLETIIPSTQTGYCIYYAVQALYRM